MLDFIDNSLKWPVTRSFQICWQLLPFRRKMNSWTDFIPQFYSNFPLPELTSLSYKKLWYADKTYYTFYRRAHNYQTKVRGLSVLLIQYEIYYWDWQQTFKTFSSMVTAQLTLFTNILPNTNDCKASTALIAATWHRLPTVTKGRLT